MNGLSMAQRVYQPPADLLCSLCATKAKNCCLLPNEITPFSNQNRNNTSALSWRVTPTCRTAFRVNTESDSHAKFSSPLSSLERSLIITTSKAFLQDSSGQNTNMDQRMLLMQAQMEMFGNLQIRK